MNYLAKLIKIGKIAGMLYRKNWNSKNSDTLIIYGIGAPIPPDNGNLPDSPIIMKYKVDLFVPDYIGYGRSDGALTPMNCINTFLKLHEVITKGTIGISHYENTKFNLQYKRILHIGRSFGGTYVPLLPRFNPNIKELCVIYPAVDNKSSGSVPSEESNEDFMNAMKFDGYHYLYRGILSALWKKHLNNDDGLSPMDNVKYLRDCRLFIGHGTKDKCIHYSKSKIYFNKIKDAFPDKIKQFVLKLYKGTGHNYQTSNRTVRDFLDWLQIIKYKSYEL